MANLTHRIAIAEDIAAISTLMDRAIGTLMNDFLSAEQVEASRAVMGLDTALIDDATYYLVFAGESLAACGGWSRRATLYGGDHSTGRIARLLDPATEPARIRAMYTDPAHVRRGAGRVILGLCEEALLAEGFARAELAATLAGEPLYRACGYAVVEHFADTSGGVAVPLIRMAKHFPSGGRLR